MLYVITYSTDTPLYHYPIATVGMMIGCAAVSVPGVLYGPELYEPLILAWGDGYHPTQWVTSIFAHLGLGHLIGNLIFLWCFGLIVEGKIGWWRFILTFLGVGIVQNLIEQTLMLGADQGGSCGASSVIYGTMVMALIWAPNCNLHGIYGYWRFVREFEAPIGMFCVGMLFWQLLMLGAEAQFTGEIQMATPLLHLMGAGVGVGFGVALLKANQVQADGLDIFSVIRGDRAKHEREHWREESAQDLAKKPAVAVSDQESERRAREFQQLVENGQAPLAWAAYQRFRKDDANWAPQRTDFLKLVGLFHNQQLWDESVPLMVEYLGRFQDRAASVRLKLASILLQYVQRPTQAKRVLEKINLADLSGQQQQLYQQLMTQAKSRLDEDAFQVVEDW